MNQREVGTRQESRAAEYLESLGYHILVRNFYRMLHQIPMDVPCRFDVVAETPEEIRVYANAFYYQGSGW